MSPAGGSHVASGLDPATSLADLELAWQEREEEAQVLDKSGFRSIALSLRVYSLVFLGDPYQGPHLQDTQTGLSSQSLQDARSLRPHHIHRIVGRTGRSQQPNSATELGRACGLQQVRIEQSEIPSEVKTRSECCDEVQTCP